MQEQVDERISARIDNKMISEIDALVKENQYSNRSEFLRTAVRTQIGSQQQPDAIAVEVTPLVLGTIDELVKRGFYLSREEAMKEAIKSFFTGSSLKNIVKDTELSEIVAGKKIEVDLESKTSRQIVSK